jgi:hypothetical protein
MAMNIQGDKYDKAMIVQALKFEADCFFGNVYPIAVQDWHRNAGQQRLDLANRIENEA